MADSADSPLVLVTGANDYLATHVIQQLQNQGYRVRASVKSTENEEKNKVLVDLCPEALHKLELIEADIAKPETWEAAVKECKYVIHIATHQPTVIPKNESEVTEPAVEAIKNVLKACQAAKSVKRVIMTSAAVTVSGEFSLTTDPEKVYTEEDWADQEKGDVLTKSKVLAEKAAFDFVKELPEDEKFELATMNPAFTFGPVLTDELSPNVLIFKRLLEHSMPAIPRINIPYVDVRDAAAAHVKALTCEEAAGHRHILYSGNAWLREMAQKIAPGYKAQGYNVPTANCPAFASWLCCLLDKTTKVLPKGGKVVKFDNTRMREKLEIEPRNLDDTLLDMCSSLIEKNLVKKPKPKKEKVKKATPEKADGEPKDEDGKIEEGDETKDKEDAEDKEEKKEDATEEKTEEKTEDAKEEKKDGEDEKDSENKEEK